MRIRALSKNLRRVSTNADYHRGALGRGQTINQIIGKLIGIRLCAYMEEDENVNCRHLGHYNSCQNTLTSP